MILRGGAMGEFVFTPPGLDQRLLEEAGFADVRAEDVTENAARVAAASHAAREGRSADLDEVEGAEQNARTQSFLWTVAKLAAEQRLSRLAYLAGERDRPFAAIRHPLGALPGRLHPVPEDYFG
jgi:hypothetical protein